MTIHYKNLYSFTNFLIQINYLLHNNIVNLISKLHTKDEPEQLYY